MTLKSVGSILVFRFTLILFMTLIPMSSVQALNSDSPGNSLPVLDVFASQIKNGQSAELRGVYIPGILAARVIQQPVGDYGFVSPRQNILTQFELATQFGSTGLLAHNDLAGESFSLLEEDQKIYLIYGDGQISGFVVTEVLHYQALEPNSPFSEFIDLENGDLLEVSDAFSRVYNRPGQVILQTCISTGNSSYWGRLFVIAEPYFQQPYPSILNAKSTFHTSRIDGGVLRDRYAIYRTTRTEMFNDVKFK